MIYVVLTILRGAAGVWLTLAQLADAGGAAAAGNGGPAPAALLLPQGGAAHWHSLCPGDAAGQAGDASSTTAGTAGAAAGHRHLGRARLLTVGQLVGKEGKGIGEEDTMGSEVTQRLQIRE